MSTDINTKGEDYVALGKEFSMTRRIVAFMAILVIYFFYCYNFMTGVFVRPTLIKEYGFTLQQASTIFAMLSFGTIPGTIFFGICSTRFGKKRTLMGIAILFSITTYLPLIDPSNFTLWRIARLVTGFSLGGVFGTAIPLITDLFPQRYRGKLAAICTSCFSIAVIFSGQLYGLLGDENWRLLIWTAILPPVIGVVLVFFLVPDDASHMEELRREAKENKSSISYIEMYKGKYLFIGIGAILLSGCNFVLYSAYSNNATTYLTNDLGIAAGVAGSIYSLQGIGQLIGYNFWGFIADRFGRKVPLIGMAASGILIFLFTKISGDNVTIFYVFSLILGICFGFSGAWGAYYSELFSEKFKSLSAGISFNGGRIISTFGLPMVAGIAATSYGMKGVFLITSLVAIAGVVIWALLPETLIKGSKENKNQPKDKEA